MADIQSGGDNAYDRKFWQERAAGNVAHNVVANRVPALMVGNWTDVHTSGIPDMYAMLQNLSFGRDPHQMMRPGQPTAPRYQVSFVEGGHCQGYEGSEEVLRWYDTHLKGVDTGMDKTKTPLRAKVLGADRTIATSAYPFTTTYTALYLGSGSVLTSEPGSAHTAQLTFASPTTVVYDTAPLSEAKLLAGPMALSIYASSTTTNLLLIADLIDVAPDGSTRLLSTGGLIGSMKELDPERTWRDRGGNLIRPYHHFQHDQHLSPGQIERFDVEMRNRVAHLEAGHRLRLVLSASPKRNEFSPENPGGRGLGPSVLSPTNPQAHSLTGATFTIHHSTEHPSRLNVPLLPASAFAGSSSSAEEVPVVGALAAAVPSS